MLRESISQEFAAGLAGQTGFKDGNPAVARAPLFLPEGERNGIIDRIETFPTLTLPVESWEEIRSGADPVLVLAPIDEVSRYSIGSEIVLRDRNGKNLALFRVTRKDEPTSESEHVPIHGNVRIISLQKE